jgi:hypothetical protein
MSIHNPSELRVPSKSESQSRPLAARMRQLVSGRDRHAVPRCGRQGTARPAMTRRSTSAALVQIEYPEFDLH